MFISPPVVTASMAIDNLPGTGSVKKVARSDTTPVHVAVSSALVRCKSAESETHGKTC